MTGVAALMTGRHAVLSDLSPAAVHIARNYCTPVDCDALRSEFERIKAAVKAEFDWLYGTTCDRCGGPATIQYTVWSDVFACDYSQSLKDWASRDLHPGCVVPQPVYLVPHSDLYRSQDGRPDRYAHAPTNLS